LYPRTSLYSIWVVNYKLQLKKLRIFIEKYFFCLKSDLFGKEIFEK
jgi:hypothetical protein